MEIKLVIPKVPMHGRKLMAGKTWRAQWVKKKNEQDEWRWWIRKELAGKRPSGPLSGVRVEVTIYRKVFDKDPDNLVYSLKPLLDALVAEGVIMDDSEKHITIGIPRQVRCLGNEQTVIKISKTG